MLVSRFLHSEMDSSCSNFLGYLAGLKSLLKFEISGFDGSFDFFVTSKCLILISSYF